MKTKAPFSLHCKGLPGYGDCGEPHASGFIRGVYHCWPRRRKASILLLKETRLTAPAIINAASNAVQRSRKDGLVGAIQDQFSARSRYYRDRRLGRRPAGAYSNPRANAA